MMPARWLPLLVVLAAEGAIVAAFVATARVLHQDSARAG